ncbi:hypothetical protein B9Z55_026986 [Caenorhabditis nigoni]|uniref:BTB domain-containing protein n=1 Tax=Caenorhabditis nigoni TaxID=1611254 RepID=A0A2G5SIW9_9PELO|nr:hypothetical protein B9Z55_026986 [Caenorhabditis nigoni]
MSKTPAPSIYETTFAESNKTDAILVVDGMKLHVNKALLSCHSTHFKALFNSGKKSTPEIEIKDVEFEDFAILLSLVHLTPLKPKNAQNAEKLLELTDQFQLPAAKRPIEVYLMAAKLKISEKIRIGEKFELDALLRAGLYAHYQKGSLRNFRKGDQFKNFSAESRCKSLHLIFEILYEQNNR